jgi:hypothetical protein
MVIKHRQVLQTGVMQASLPPSNTILANMPVVTSPSGKIVSAYCDWLWDYRSHVASNKGEGVLYFNKEPYLSNPGILQDVRYLLWILINRHFEINQFHSVSAYLNWSSVFHHLSRYCLEEGIDIGTCLSEEAIFVKFVESHCPSSRKSTAVTIFKILFSLHAGLVGCQMFDIYHSNFGTLTEPSEEEQTLVVPSRLLCHGIKTTKKIISDFTQHLVNLKQFTLKLHREAAGFSEAQELQHQAKIAPKLFNNMVDRYGLRYLSECYNWDSAASFGRYLSEVQFSCKTLVHIYSGMRDDEAYSLLPGCLREEWVDGELGYWLHGITTKGYGRKQPAAWVTSVDIRQAINACEGICNWIKKACGIKRTIPLFSNISHFTFALAHKRTKPNEADNKLANLTHVTFNRIFNSPEFIITKEDSVEVQFIEYTRNWDIENVYVTGAQWNFTTHQFRRSLAYYGIESGLIRYSSLHEQLQHIRMRMTTHYSKGGKAANSLIGHSQFHFKHELKRVSSIVQALDYVKTILLSDEKIYGGHGKHVERNIKPLGRDQILQNRQKTVEHVQAGLIAYTSRATGGCMSANACHRHLIHPFSACTGCADAVLIPSRIRLAIATFKNFITSLHPNSPEHISATHELELTVDLMHRQNIQLT